MWKKVLLASVVVVAGVGGAALAERIRYPGGAAIPIGQTEVVYAYDTDVYHIWFRGGEVAMVSIVGDGDTDLDLTVYDEFGNEVASSRHYHDRETVVWRPRVTSRYRIEVRNFGSVSNLYRLTTN